VAHCKETYSSKLVLKDVVSGSQDVTAGGDQVPAGPPEKEFHISFMPPPVTYCYTYTMEMKLEVVMLPVTNVDASIEFYKTKVGFNLDHDIKPGNGMRIVQLTPPGSGCSIVFGEGMGGLAEPGSIKNTHLVVTDIEKARNQLAQNGVEISEVNDMGGVMYAYFADPDGNSWALQETNKAL
jgi:catechol 2,3-dioxygenase-like lactoylglutathione lyase family enzyme